VIGQDLTGGNGRLGGTLVERCTTAKGPGASTDRADGGTISMTDQMNRMKPVGGRTLGPPTTLDGLPLMLTIAEATKVLQMSPNSAYKLAEEHRATGGRSGLPTRKLGGRLLVRLVDLAAIVGVEPPR